MSKNTTVIDDLLNIDALGIWDNVRAFTFVTDRTSWKLGDLTKRL